MLYKKKEIITDYFFYHTYYQSYSISNIFFILKYYHFYRIYNFSNTTYYKTAKSNTDKQQLILN